MTRAKALAPATTGGDGVARQAALRKFWTFLVLTAALSAVFDTLIISAGSLNARGGLYLIALMWSPGIAALLTRLIYQGNVAGEGWGWGSTRWQLLSYVLPIAYAAVAYGAVWLTGFGGVGRFTDSLPVFIVAGTLQSGVTALGEELGWRGFLVPELAKRTTFARTAIVSGVIWAVWHLPIIVFADYNSGTPKAYGVLCFFVMVVAISLPLAWLRLRSGSVWTAVLMHASHNLWIQSFFDRITIDTGSTRWFTTEFGAALALASVALASIFWRQRKALHEV